MSGGSFHYLCYKESADLISELETLGQMRDALVATGYAQDAAKETEELILIINQFLVRVETRRNRLYSVWRAMEWWRSGDSMEEQFRMALTEYREK